MYSLRLWSSLFLVKACSDLNDNDPIRSQFCMCHDSPAVFTCAKLWPDLIVRIRSNAKRTFTNVNYEVINLSWNSPPGSLPGLTASQSWPLVLCRKTVKESITGHNTRHQDVSFVCPSIDCPKLAQDQYCLWGRWPHKVLILSPSYPLDLAGHKVKHHLTHQILTIVPLHLLCISLNSLRPSDAYMHW